MTIPRILLVQEIEIDGIALYKGLQALGYLVTWKRSIGEGISALRSDAFDVVLSALHTEKASSFDLLRAAKAVETLSRIPFIFCCLRPSSYTMTTYDAVLFTANKLGANDIVILKALDMELVGKRLRVALDKASSHCDMTTD